MAHTTQSYYDKKVTAICVSHFNSLTVLAVKYRQESEQTIQTTNNTERTSRQQGKQGKSENS